MQLGLLRPVPWTLHVSFEDRDLVSASAGRHGQQGGLWKTTLDLQGPDVGSCLGSVTRHPCGSRQESHLVIRTSDSYLIYLWRWH